MRSFVGLLAVFLGRIAGNIILAIVAIVGVSQNGWSPTGIGPDERQWSKIDRRYPRRAKDGPDIMPQNFYILRDDEGRWVVSDQSYDNGLGRGYRSYGEAFDQLRAHLSSKGLVMGKTYPEGGTFRVEALIPGEPAADVGPMLYSAEALSYSDTISNLFGHLLRSKAKAIARGDGRSMVTRDDIASALDGMTMADVNPNELSVDGN